MPEMSGGFAVFHSDSIQINFCVHICVVHQRPPVCEPKYGPPTQMLQVGSYAPDEHNDISTTVPNGETKQALQVNFLSAGGTEQYSTWGQ